MGALAYAIQLLGVVPGLISSGRDVIALLADGKAKLQEMQVQQRDPTDAEWEELNRQIAVLQTELHKKD